MAKEYISYIQTENLIKNWNILQGIKESLALDIKTLDIDAGQEEVDDYIYTKVIGNKVMSDTPPSGKISDTTANTAIIYPAMMKQDCSEVLECFRREKLHIDIVSDKLDIGYRRLDKLQQRIIDLFYLEEKTWAEVMDALRKEKHFISKYQAQVNRRNSIETIQKISKITVTMYECVAKLVEVE